MNDLSPPGVGAARLIGQRVPRKEDGRLLTGRGQYVDDISLPGMLHCAFARSPIARGKILKIDTEIARDMPGVHAIYTMDDLRRVPCTMMSFFLAPTMVTATPLADGRVAYAGDPIVLVIADTRALAEDAAALVEIEYEEEKAVVTIADAMAAGPIHPDQDSNCAAEAGMEELDEDLEAALEGAAHVVEHRVRHARISQSPMETRGVVVSKDGAEELTVWITCQSPSMIARYLTLALGLPNAAIRVIAKDVGGSFGLKNHPWREEMSVILAAMIFGRPLKWIEDRLENLTSANQAREQEMVLRVAFDADGKFVASHGDYNVNNGAFPQGEDANIAVHMFMWPAYHMPAYSFHSRGWYTNTVGLAAYRGPWAMESLIRETALDKAARRIGIDPVEIRRKNLVKRADLPVTTPLGVPVDDLSSAECLEKLIAAFDIAAFRREQAEARKQGRYLGLGIAAYVEPTGSAGSMTVMTGETAQLRIDPTGKVTATMTTHSQGHGTATTMAQIIGDRLGVPYEDVTVFEGDSSRGGGFSPGAAGSRQGVIAGGATVKAAELLAEKVKAVASHLLNADVASITIENGEVRVAGAEEMSRPLRAIAEIAYGEPDRMPPGMEGGLQAQFHYQPPPMTLTSAAHLCTVEVDAETGFVKILRWISAEDCGNVINPAVVEGQIAGGLAQAIGTVLLEAFEYDAQGNPTTVTYKDYLLPAISDVPDFEYVHANIPSQSVGGFRGVGEGGAIIGPPTLVNAIADALSPFGEIEVALPLTPSKILSVIEGRDIASHAHPEPLPEALPIAEETALPPVDAAVLPGGAAATEAPLIDGDWKMVLSTPMGPQEMTGHFESDGTALKGYLSSPEGQQDFEGTVEGTNVKFDLKVTKPMKITLKYDLIVEGDEITGKCKMGMFGTAKVKAERIGERPAAGVPVAAPAPPPPPEPEPAVATIAGDWKMVLSTPMGPQEMEGHFETDGAALSGYLNSPEGQQPFDGGTVDGQAAKFDLKVTKPMKITLKYDLIVEGDTLSGKCKMGMFGTAKVKGERIT